MPKIRLYHPRIELRVSLQDPRFAKFFRVLFEHAMSTADSPDEPCVGLYDNDGTVWALFYPGDTFDDVLKAVGPIQ